MQKSFEKLILAGCAVLGIGVIYLGYSKKSALEEDFAYFPKASGNCEIDVVGAAKLDDTLANVEKPIMLERAIIGANQRPVDNFVGVSLFAKKPANGEKTAKPVDPVLDAPIHPPIPNLWWLQNRLEPGFADSPQRDEDGDGFSNIEEFHAQTDPNDPQSYPPLIDKLEFVKYESIGYFLWFSSSLGPQKYQFKITELPPAFEAAPPAAQENFLGQPGLKFNRTDGYIGDNTNIFDKDFGKGRFRLKEVREKEVTNEATKLTTTLEFAVIEDLAPHKKDTFEIPKMPRSRERPATVRYDRTAIFVLNAIGEQNKEFKVLENASFSLPSDKGEKNYHLKKISPDSVTVEYKSADGETKTIEIKKSR